jgi:hypothetical protein
MNKPTAKIKIALSSFIDVEIKSAIPIENKLSIIASRPEFFCEPKIQAEIVACANKEEYE